MRTKTKRSLLSASLAFCCSVTAWAQSININLCDYEPVRQDIVEFTQKGVSFSYIQSGTTPHGAYISYASYADYSLTISAEKNITPIEFEGTLLKNSNANLYVSAGDGNLNLNPSGTSTWSGSAQ